MISHEFPFDPSEQQLTNNGHAPATWGLKTGDYGVRVGDLENGAVGFISNAEHGQDALAMYGRNYAVADGLTHTAYPATGFTAAYVADAAVTMDTFDHLFRYESGLDTIYGGLRAELKERFGVLTPRERGIPMVAATLACASVVERVSENETLVDIAVIGDSAIYRLNDGKVKKQWGGKGQNYQNGTLAYMLGLYCNGGPIDPNIVERGADLKPMVRELIRVGDDEILALATDRFEGTQSFRDFLGLDADAFHAKLQQQVADGEAWPDDGALIFVKPGQLV